MNPSKLKNILALSLEEKYYYFIRKCTELEEVWGLHNEGWATLGDDENNTIIPFWPEEEFAKLNCSNNWQKCQPKPIALNDFIAKWIPGMIEDKRLANIFYFEEGSSKIIITPQQLLEDINSEMEKYL
jgi:hypothetical protein